MRGRQIQQRRGAPRQQLRVQSVPIDGDTDDFGARGLKGIGRAEVARLLHDTERAARQKQSRRDGQPLLDAGYNDDSAGIGHDSSRRRQMIGDRGAQRRKPCRLAILSQSRCTTMRQVCLQQAAPGLEREQISARTPGKEVKQQAVAVGGGWRLDLPWTQRQRHPLLQRLIPDG
jgi:hypothetical protein